MQRQSVHRPGGAPAAPPIVHEVIQTSGRPLPLPMRGLMEQRLGHDFSHVRIHDDSGARASAAAVDATAYTVGNHVVFGSGQGADPSGNGQQLLAHELVHVMQQESGTSASGPIAVSRAADAAESEARTIAGTIHGSAAGVVRVTPFPSMLARVDIPLWDCPHRVAVNALEQARRSGLPGLHNGPADAYRHCWWSCQMVNECSWLGAYVAGTGHEVTDWTPVESDMDLNNNAAGRDCGGGSASCDACCRAKLANGKLTVMTSSTSVGGYYGQDAPRSPSYDTPNPNAPTRY
jgi:hypothetical protein